MIRTGISIEAVPALFCDICRTSGKGIIVRHGDECVRVCQHCVDRWHTAAAGPFGTRQIYSMPSEYGEET